MQASLNARQSTEITGNVKIVIAAILVYTPSTPMPLNAYQVGEFQ